MRSLRPLVSPSLCEGFPNPARTTTCRKRGFDSSAPVENNRRVLRTSYIKISQAQSHSWTMADKDEQRAHQSFVLMQDDGNRKNGPNQRLRASETHRTKKEQLGVDLSIQTRMLYSLPTRRSRCPCGSWLFRLPRSARPSDNRSPRMLR